MRGQWPGFTVGMVLLSVVILLLLILTLACSQLSWGTPPIVKEMTLGHSTRTGFYRIIADSLGNNWGLFVSKYYGFAEFWTCFRKQGEDWGRPVYTGVPARPGFYDWDMNEYKFTMKYKRKNVHPRNFTYVRDNILSKADSIEIPLASLYLDSDMDGLSDLAEDVLWTDRDNNDSDGDGKADGYDPNPLAGEPEKLFIHERLHKTIIEKELRSFESSQMVLVEQINHKPMEYDRPQGFVLSLSPEDLDEFVNINGYGVPILTTAIKDTLRKYKVSFQFFVAPDDAWGYDALYDWDRKKGIFVRKRVYSDWHAEEQLSQ
jgi:hypothetical protein